MASYMVCMEVRLLLTFSVRSFSVLIESNFCPTATTENISCSLSCSRLHPFGSGQNQPNPQMHSLSHFNCPNTCTMPSIKPLNYDANPQHANNGRVSNSTRAGDTIKVEFDDDEQSASRILQPSTQFNNPHVDPQHSTNDEDDVYDEELLAQVKREIKEEELENLKYKSISSNRQIEHCDDDEEYDGDMSYQVGQNAHQVQFGQVETISPSTDDHEIQNMDLTHSNGQIDQLSNQTVYDDDHQQQPNGHVNNATTDTQQLDCDQPEEGDDDDATEIDSANEDGIEDNQNELENSRIEPIQPHSIERSQAIVRRSTRLVKRKQTEEDEPNQVNNLVEVEEEDYDGSDVDHEVQHEQVTARSVKRTRSSRPTTSSSAKKQTITLSLECPQCEQMFTKDEFYAHLKVEHSIERYRCLLCTQSFNTKLGFSGHIKQRHNQSRSNWTCSEVTCKYETPNSSDLNSHWNRFHKKGVFKCARCRATFAYRNKVHNHFNRKHSKTSKKSYNPVACDHEGCDHVARDKSDLKRHQITHTKLKPFECTWDGCDFACNRYCHAIRHVYSKHFKIPQSVKAKERKRRCRRDPSQFVRKINC